MTNTSQKGFSLILSTVMLGLVMAYGYIVFAATLSIQNQNKTFERSLSASQLAEAGAHKAIYCLRATVGTNCGGTYGDSYVGESSTALGDGTYSTTVSGTGNIRSIVAIGTAAGGRSQTLKLDMTNGYDSVPIGGFDLAVLLGTGGTFTMNNGAGVNHGDSYIGTDLTCSNNATFNGYDLYNYKEGGRVSNCTKGIRDLHADILSNDAATRDLYCQVKGGSTAGRVRFGICPWTDTPDAPAIPPLDTTFWHTAAEAGGTYTGDYYAATGSTLGPLRINGNLYTNNNAVVTLTGPVWVNGDVNLSNNSVIKLDPALSQTSSIILADSLTDPANHGKILIGNNTSLNSTSDGSYIVFASTNTGLTSGAPAINIQNNAVSVLLWAPYGAVNVSNNATVNAVVAKSLYLDNNCYVNYDNAGITPSSLTIVTTSSSANKWRIKPATWREYW